MCHGHTHPVFLGFLPGTTLAASMGTGRSQYSNITLKRGFTADLSLWKWIKGVLDGNAVRAAVTITLLNDQRQAVVRWNVREAWPCKYEGPDLNAKGNEIAIETLELCHEGFERVE